IVRLQGVDAPELHYRPLVRAARVWRQPGAESAVLALVAFLTELARGGSEGACVVTTEGDKPNDVFDIYARFIGDLVIAREKGPPVDVISLAGRAWLGSSHLLRVDEAERDRADREARADRGAARPKPMARRSQPPPVRSGSRPQAERRGQGGRRWPSAIAEA